MPASLLLFGFGKLQRLSANFLPLLLIILSAASLLLYLNRVDIIIASYAGGTNFSRKTLLDSIEPRGPMLMIYYLGIYLCAEMSFVVMALRE